MKEILATLTQRGLVTVPVEVRRVLGIKPREKVAFTIDGDQVRLVPATFTLESAYGSVRPRNTPEDFDTLIAEAMEKHADAAARLRPIVALRGLKLPDKRLYLRALDLYASSTQLDFGNAVAVARMETQGIAEIYSYDTDFDVLTTVTRVEP